MKNGDEAYFRAINVKAPTEILFRWLCQQVGLQLWLDWPPRGRFPFQDSISNPQIQNNYFQVWKIWALGPKSYGRFFYWVWTKSAFNNSNGWRTSHSDVCNIATSYVVSSISESTCRLILKGHILYPGIAFVHACAIFCLGRFVDDASAVFWRLKVCWMSAILAVKWRFRIWEEFMRRYKIVFQVILAIRMVVVGAALYSSRDLKIGPDLPTT